MNSPSRSSTSHRWEPRLDKKLGQHHLRDGAVCRPLVEYLAPRGRRLVEIGAGGGVLTGELLAAGAETVLAWELDPAWAATLPARLPDRRLRVVVGDALALDFRRTAPLPTRVAGNLPYNVATAIIERLLRHPGAVDRAAFLVQREVAERLTAGPGDSAYGGLSVLVAAHARARLLGRVKAGSFRPPPKVESAFVGLEPLPPPLPEDAMVAFLAMVRLAFGQRRKTLANALAAGWGKAAARHALEAAGIDARSRAEELDLERLLVLFRGRPGHSAATPSRG
ncbi:MAG: 16S rRNA (adenine(1518)-N(6)/adenine(1519)-N(6))-dimethyltransferase RsmA [Acidobacteriota bacterium]